MNTIRYSFFLFCIMMVLSCERREDHSAIINNLNQEIKDRMSILTGLSKYDDSLSYHTAAIHNEVNRLILLSKDVENKSANVYEGNVFFNRMAAKYGTEEKDYPSLQPGMNMPEIETLLKQNELFLYNQIIFKNSGADIRLFSVQEEE